MRLRLVTTASGQPSVAVAHNGRWAPLASMSGLPDDLDHAEMTAVLAVDGQTWQTIEEQAPQAAMDAVTVGPTAPVVPLSLRTFPIWRSELERIAATSLRRFGGTVGRKMLDLTGGRSNDLVGRLIGSHWVQVPQGLRGNHIQIRDADQALPWPSFTQALDVEFGLAAIIVRHVDAGAKVHATDVVGGYTLAATAVARDLEHAEVQGSRFGPTASRDIATVISSEVVTANALPDGRLSGLKTTLSVGEEVWAEASTAGARHTFDDVLTRAAQAGGLQPGEVIVATAPPAGTCAALDRWPSPGDLVTFEVEEFGAMTVAVGDPQPHLHDGWLDRPPWTVVERRGHGPSAPALDPQPWTPPPVPDLTGPLATNEVLDRPDVWHCRGASKPEDVAIGPDRSVYSGVEDGRIYRWGPEGGDGTVIADTHGRPLGIEVTHNGDLVVCDADRGLLRLPTDGHSVGEVEVLADTHAGLALKFANNAAVAGDGTVYFSDSSTRFGVHYYRQEIQENAGNGRIFAWHPGAHGQLDLVASGLHFPNGVALTPEQDALLIAETSRFRLSRLWLSGDRAGQVEVLNDGLPGFPDNLCANGDGTYWLAIPNRRLPVLDTVLPYPALRKIVDKLPDAVQPQPDRYSMVLMVDGDGEILQSLHGPAGDYAMVTGMRQQDGWLYLSSLLEEGIARVKLAD